MRIQTPLFATLITLVTLAAAPRLAPAQSETPKPPEAPAAEPLPTGWTTVDARVVFLTTQLASAEASIDAIDKALHMIGYKIIGKQSEAERFRLGNEYMDRNGGGPVRWDDFYGDTARKFYYHDTFITTAQIQRPPQFDYIYRANDDRQRIAQADAAALGNKAENLLARKRQLESLQSALWAKIAFRIVASRNLADKTIYRFELNSQDKDAQHLEAIRASCDFIRVINAVITQAQESVDSDQAGVYSRLFLLTKSAHATLDDRLIHQPSLALDLSASYTQVGKLNYAIKRLEDIAKNIDEASRLAAEGDIANDLQQKNTFRGQLQEMLVNYAQNFLTAEQCVDDLTQTWKMFPDPAKPLESAVPPSLPAEVAAAPLARSIKLRITATIDGSDELRITTAGALWNHKSDGSPRNIVVGGIAWDVGSNSALDNHGATAYIDPNADLAAARIVYRKGRGSLDVAIDKDALVIKFSDPQPRADDYAVEFEVPIRQPVVARTAADPAPMARGANALYAAGVPIAGLSREAILQMLANRTWYWHWENENRDHPTTFAATADGQPGGNWKLELRWVIKQDTHMVILLDPNRFRGFYIPDGRQVGMFADPLSPRENHDLLRDTGARTAQGSDVTGMTRDDVLKILPARTWYWHWEGENRDHPFAVTLAPDGRDILDKVHSTLELRWVLNDTGHIVIPVDANRLRGFYIPTGRKVGFFADAR